MDYEKAYKEALERARGHHGVAINYGKSEEIQELEHIFPELAKSEDERIRKDLIVFICEFAPEHLKAKFVSYLEKQKEQKPSAVEVLNSAGLKTYRDGDQWCILVGDNIQEGICGFGDTISEALYEFLNDWRQQKPAEWSEEEIKLLNSIIDDYEKAAKSFCGYDGKIGLLKAIRDGEYDLLKQVWSEEDEKTANKIRLVLFGHADAQGAPTLYNEEIDWLTNRLKLLRPQPHWKPSEEQMAMLRAVLNEPKNAMSESAHIALESLYSDLKKL